jgi:hypothetical protein
VESDVSTSSMPIPRARQHSMEEIEAGMCVAGVYDTDSSGGDSSSGDDDARHASSGGRLGGLRRMWARATGHNSGRGSGGGGGVGKDGGSGDSSGGVATVGVTTGVNESRESVVNRLGGDGAAARDPSDDALAGMMVPLCAMGHLAEVHRLLGVQSQVSGTRGNSHVCCTY